jgi:hypothetical protein
VQAGLRPRRPRTEKVTKKISIKRKWETKRKKECKYLLISKNVEHINVARNPQASGPYDIPV